MKKKLLISLVGCAAIAGGVAAAIAMPKTFASTYAETVTDYSTFNAEMITDCDDDGNYCTLDGWTNLSPSYKYSLTDLFWYAPEGLGTGCGDDFICNLSGSSPYDTYLMFSFSLWTGATLTSVEFTGQFDGDASVVLLANDSAISFQPTSDETTNDYAVFWGMDYTNIKLVTITINWSC